MTKNYIFFSNIGHADTLTHYSNIGHADTLTHLSFELFLEIIRNLYTAMTVTMIDETDRRYAWQNVV